jgi:acyl-CoA synthetase (NDP forming)
MSENPLHLLMNPKSIATAGAGNNLMKMGTIQTLNLLTSGYKGAYYPIHPRDKTVLGRRAYPSPSDLPEVPDLAFIIVPTEQVAPVLDEFGKIGTRRAVVVTAGFRETGEAGRILEAEMSAVAEKHGIRFVGPNCVGIINTQASVNTTVGPHGSGPGSLGLASQSGTYVTQTLPYLARRGIRFSKAISLGNEADINIVDALEYLGEDKDTKAIILYIEGIREGRRFIETARKITPRKPVLALYVGGSEAGARSGMSHTGAMAGPDYLYDGIFKQAGIIRVQTIEELYAHGWAFATQPLLKGNRLGIVTNSGGPGTSISHAADTAGLTLPRFSDSLQEAIRKMIPGHAASRNPVDLTFHLDMKALSTTIPNLIMKSGEVDGLIIHGVISFLEEANPALKKYLQGVSLEEMAKQLLVDLSEAVTLPERYGTPMLISSFFDRRDSYVAFYQDHHIPVLDSPEKAAKAMADLYRYNGIRQRKPAAAPDVPERSVEAAERIASALKKSQKGLDEYEGKQILSAYGIPVTRERLASTEAEALNAAREIGFPVALKACSWEIMHKTGKGLIRLGLGGEGEVTAAFRSIREAALGDIPVLVQEMVPGSREFVMGMTRFPGFGPVLLFGLGGIFTEALKDTAFRSAPLSLAEAEEMIRDIKSANMLEAFRGMPAVDMPALAEILQTLGFIAMLHPEIAEMDLNPLIISGSRPVVADALIIVNSE